MAVFPGFVALAGTLAAVMAGLVWLVSRARRRGIGGVMGPFEEVWHPAAHRSRIEVQVREERPAPTPSPGDRPLPLEKGGGTSRPGGGDAP